MRRNRSIALFTCVFTLTIGVALRASGACPVPVASPAPVTPPDLEITTACSVGAGVYLYRNVNVYGGGVLKFEDARVHFWAQSILVEKDGSLLAGTEASPIGTSASGEVTIHLWGADQGVGTGAGNGGQGIVCKTDAVTCGVPSAIWDTTNATPIDVGYGAGLEDYFYKYKPLIYDDGGAQKGYFGYKTIGVSWGGTLKLFGKKGATYGSTEPASSDSGTSWVRLDKTTAPDDQTVSVDRDVPSWKAGDRIVVTTTDYLPGHSEELTIKAISGRTLTVEEKLKYIHNGERFSLARLQSKEAERLSITETSAETRAAVGLLTRSIRVVSATAFTEAKNECRYDCFPETGGPDAYFGGDVTVRQGFKSVQLQGVEFFQLGQGGRMGHYPVHFHMARRTPHEAPNVTFVKDCSVHDSMTRWIVLHGTQDVLLARNVGWKSIGHGYYLEDGTETNNKLYSNLGVFARTAAQKADGTAQRDNPRKVPGILAAPDPAPVVKPTPEPPATLPFPNRSDFVYPSVFWVMNGWNDLEYNMAAGAAGCGACFWPVLGSISGESRNQKWTGYASIQQGLARGGTAPLKKFKGNYCTSAMNSFNSTPDSGSCHGFIDGDLTLRMIPKKENTGTPAGLAPVPSADPNAEMHYPIVYQHLPAYTRCEGETERPQGDCSTLNVCSGVERPSCMVTVVDRYTSSFNWGEKNFSSIWLRPRWFLVQDSVITDVQNGALTFVTGGDYTHSSVISGNWMLARRNVFIGETQKSAVDTTDPTKPAINPFVSAAGPFNPLKTGEKPTPKLEGLRCSNSSTNYCMSLDEGISMQLDAFGVNQRFFNIYDGPSLQDSNAYLDIKETKLSNTRPDGCPFPNVNQQCNDSRWMYGRVLGLPGEDSNAYLPNAAIAWKQPNGFYYPPAFHSLNLFFDNVDIRHYVFQPLFKAETKADAKTGETWFETDEAAAKKKYATWNPQIFKGWTAIDRQTVLNDDDGTLTGLKNTLSVNDDPFFRGPRQTTECASDETVNTSPYDYVTTVIYPECAKGRPYNATGCEDPLVWNRNCTSDVGLNCYGIPLYRQLLTAGEPAGEDQKIRMMGPDIWGRIQLTVDNGIYYVSTTDGTAQQSSAILRNIFKGGQTYYLFLVYAKETTKQTYQMYVGTGQPANFDKTNVKAVGVDLATKDLVFDELESEKNDQGVKKPIVWDTSYEPSSGILTVTLDLKSFKKGLERSALDACQPAPFCAPNAATKKCECSPTLMKDDPDLYAQCQGKPGVGGRPDQVSVCEWAVKDLDCPVFDDNGTSKSRCVGFSVTLPAEPAFLADGVNRRPMPQPFPSGSNAWTQPFQPASKAEAGDCFYLTPPGDNVAPRSRDEARGRGKH